MNSYPVILNTQNPPFLRDKSTKIPNIKRILSLIIFKKKGQLKSRDSLYI